MATYKVKAGDTFDKIAKAHNVPLQSLLSANPGVHPSALQVGQTITLPSAGSPMTKYQIKPGDTLDKLAKANNISLQSLLGANKGVNPSALQVGQIIFIPRGPAPSGPGGAPGKSSVGGPYVNYAGPASAFPDPSRWAPYDVLVKQNERLIRMNASADETSLILKSVAQVAKESGVDARCILCTVMQESAGNPKVMATNNGVRNPGLMQSHNGASFNPRDPAGSILQMIRDGTTGTKDGAGLKQLRAQYGNWYEAFRGYNSGSVDRGNLNNAMGATQWYVRDMANRLMGHIWDRM
ncbi:hypothetical protein CAC42_2166 [Sphaceloma murrayae]|uniref:LysM domain-containing protein n=1 Tax=Sphaceloma murrayae TaxID=2082308 RepID=A0A2K1QIH0_9PEZI|nr:hypothetical protein CAC42_2166 [Sphaceloma murrayae]